MSGIRGSKNTEPTVKFYYADGPEEGFPWHRPQELVGRCRLGTTVTKTVLLAYLNKKKLFVTEKFNQDPDLHGSTLDHLLGFGSALQPMQIPKTDK